MSLPLVLLAWAWAAGPPTAAPAEQTVQVFAAASLKDSFQEIAQAFAAQAGGRVQVMVAGSQVLRMQIEQGARTDVYAFADEVDARALLDKGLVQPYRVFAHNALCVVVPAARPHVRSLAELAHPGTKVVVAGPTVPAGRYTEQVLERMQASGAFGARYATHVRANVVSQETSVRFVLAKVALGEADAGFVYRTDAAATRAVGRLDIPERMNVVASYPIGLARTPAKDQARAFVEFVLGPVGREILDRHGFRLPSL